MQGLTNRQTQILKALVDEYIENAGPVGSEILEKKHNLGVSSATIRNEMVELTQMGFLKQPHTSAGRVPTSKAMKFYIDQLMEEKKLSITEEVKAKEEVWDVRDNLEDLIAETVHAMAGKTGSLALAVSHADDKVWHSGYANVFTNPEFSDVQVCMNLFSLLEEINALQEIFFERLVGMSGIGLLFGDDLGWPVYDPITVVGSTARVGGKEIALGIISPARLTPRAIPIVKYYKNLLEEVAG